MSGFNDKESNSNNDKTIASEAESTRLISEARDFGSLFTALDAIGSLQGSTGKTYYNAAQLKEVILKLVENPELSPKLLPTITRASGLRNKVGWLLNEQILRHDWKLPGEV